jgi:putative endonuclease
MNRVDLSDAWVYLLRCADGSLYCGWTVDVEARLAKHQAGTASRYTRRRLPVELAWSRPMPDRSAAMREEARIKRLPRAEKLALLVADLNADLFDVPLEVRDQEADRLGLHREVGPGGGGGGGDRGDHAGGREQAGKTLGHVR